MRFVPSMLVQRCVAILLLFAACADDDSGSGNPGPCEPFPAVVYLIVPGVEYTIGNMRAVPPLAVGGQVVARVYCGTNLHVPMNQPLYLPYLLDDQGGAGVRATYIASDQIELVGVAAGMNDMTLKGGSAVDARFTLRAADIASVELRRFPEEWKSDQTMPWSWAPGSHAFALPVLAAGGEVLNGLQPTATSFPNTVNAVAFPGRYRIDVPTPGDFSIDVTAGALTTTIPFSVSDHADSIALDSPDLQLSTQHSNGVCFDAFEQGRRVIGLPWSFTTLAMSEQALYPNCLSVLVTDAQKGQTVDVTASAGGQTLTVSLPVI